MGNVLILSETDYQYGAGSLRLRVDRIDRVHPLYDDGENWYTVEGTQISDAGTDLGPRQVLVRARRLFP